MSLNSVREPECPEGKVCDDGGNWKAVVTFIGKRNLGRKGKTQHSYTYTKQKDTQTNTHKAHKAHKASTHKTHTKHKKHTKERRGHRKDDATSGEISHIFSP
jgi:hypothetical protein